MNENPTATLSSVGPFRDYDRYRAAVELAKTEAAKENVAESFPGGMPVGFSLRTVVNGCPAVYALLDDAGHVLGHGSYTTVWDIAYRIHAAKKLAGGHK